MRKLAPLALLTIAMPGMFWVSCANPGSLAKMDPLMEAPGPLTPFIPEGTRAIHDMEMAPIRDTRNGTPSPSPSPEPTACHDRITLLENVTIPEGLVLRPGEPFVKIWRLENGGTCPWAAGYALVFESGNRMAGDSVVPLRQVVQPGEQMELSVALVAPMESGTYTGYWMLQNAEGEKFGLGRNADEPIWVIITVPDATDPAD